jgi:tRNA uridine 5-carbamoylmethylation protein Kti12
MKKLILVTSPPASGKTYVSKKLAQALNHVVYLDKDTLIVLSKQIFKVAHETYNRSSDFFEENIRNYEYEAIVDIALEALDYSDTILINAPFTREIRDLDYINSLKLKLAKKDTKLVIIWVITDVEVVHQRMIQRNSDRDKWKLDNWEEYISRQNFSIPTSIDNPDVADDLLLFYNSSEEEFQESLSRIVNVLEN